MQELQIGDYIEYLVRDRTVPGFVIGRPKKPSSNEARVNTWVVANTWHPGRWVHVSEILRASNKDADVPLAIKLRLRYVFENPGTLVPWHLVDDARVPDIVPASLGQFEIGDLVDNHYMGLTERYVVIGHKSDVVPVLAREDVTGMPIGKRHCTATCFKDIELAMKLRERYLNLFPGGMRNIDGTWSDRTQKGREDGKPD